MLHENTFQNNAIAEYTDPREMLGEELTLNFKAQYAGYEHYLSLAEKQRLVLINRQLVGNEELNLQSEEIVQYLFDLELRRIDLTERLLVFHPDPQMGLENNSIRCEQIYPCLYPQEAAKLKHWRDALVEKLKILRFVLDTNAALAENGQKIIHTTIGILTSVVNRKHTDRFQVYGRQGQVHQDRSQVRNLINRMV